MGRAMAKMFPDLHCDPVKYIPLQASLPRPVNLVEADEMTFTIARDPESAALSGFAEVHAYHTTLQTRFNATYIHVNCTECANCWYNAFLNDIDGQKNKIGEQFFHVYPQVTKSMTSLKLDAVLELDTLDEDLSRLAGVFGTRYVSIIPRKGAQHSRRHEVCLSRVNLTADAELQRRFCRLYFADYACFRYSLPKSCQGMKLW